MATLSGSSLSVYGHTSIGIRVDSSSRKVFGCYVAAYFSGTYAQADDAIISNVHTAIQDSLRSGATVVPRAACFAFPGDEGGTAIGARTVAVSGNNITLELTGADLTTEHANAALATMNEPVHVYVTYVISP